jgi:hypothetical protein
VATKVIGRRAAMSADVWADVDRLAALAVELRERRPLCRSGVFRFRSFEEADTWMRGELIAERHGLRDTKATVRPHDAADRLFLADLIARRRQTP